MIEGLVGSALAAALIFAGFLFVKRQISSSGGAEKEALLQELPKVTTRVEELLSKSDQFASKLQLDSIAKQAQTTQADLEKEKLALKETEGRLDQAQKDVEGKESVHQELKTAREEDDAHLQELLERFSQVSTESIGLEQKLAASMKNLDKLLDEAQLTPDQTLVFQELNRAMTDASARLRDLLIEYTTVKERLELLKQQHKDLEEEYTRLVEQQLGE